MRKVSVSRRCHRDCIYRIISNRQGGGVPEALNTHMHTHIPLLPPSHYNPSNREGFGGLRVITEARGFVSIAAIQAGLSPPTAPMGKMGMGATDEQAHQLAQPPQNLLTRLLFPDAPLFSVIDGGSDFHIPAHFQQSFSNFCCPFEFDFLSVSTSCSASFPGYSSKRMGSG